MPEETAVPADTAPATPDMQEPAEPTRWQYVGPVERTYCAVPVTVQTGDVIEHAGVPAGDGCWKPTRKAVTRHPDNAPKE